MFSIQTQITTSTSINSAIYANSVDNILYLCVKIVPYNFNNYFEFEEAEM